MADSPLLKRPRFRAFHRRPRRGAVLDGIGFDHVSTESQSRRAGLYIIPNLFTSAALFMALFAIVKAAEGNFIAACWLILAAAVCDAIDGPVARLTRTSSSFGLQYDSLVDLVAFGVAPAFLMYLNLRSLDEGLPSHAPKLALGVTALYAICSAIRLARFNVQAHTAEKRMFSGLPTPGAAGVVVTAYLFTEWITRVPFVIEAVDRAWLALNLHRMILALMAILSFLMVSEIPFPKLRNLLMISRNPVNTLVFIVVAVCLVITLQGFLPAILFFGFLFYIAAAVYVQVRRKLFTGSPVHQHAEGLDGGSGK